MGTTLLGLRRGAEILGFEARPVKASPELIDHLAEAPLPAIIHWKGYHWVVLYGQKGKKYIIADPGVGVRYLSRRELAQAWANGVMLLLLPDENRFYEQPNDEVKGFRRVLRRVWPYRAVLAEALLLNLIVGLLSLALPLVIQILTDEVLVRGDRDLLTTVALAAIALIGFSSILQLIQSNLIAHFAQRLELGLILDFGRQLLRLPMNYYESHRSGEIVSRLRDIREVNFLVSQIIISLPSEFFIAVVSLGLMLIYSWKLTLAAIAISILMVLPSLLFFPTLQRKTRDVLVTEAENQGILVENFKGIMTLKTSHGATQAWEELQSRFGRLANVTFRTVEIAILNNFTGADEFISQLPDKYQTVLGEFGANLSGGQKQRLAIARALVANPPILILDESTGALDPISETQLLERLIAYRQGKTTLTISHRPRVISRADWIILLEDGKLKLTGTPEELRGISGEHLDFLK
ncbi:MAG: peptidase domain-containing ABC transporter [Spirulinaceae cyanobacterium]